ncbi:MAG: T9SS type A sorting domain-containing protein [Candidatus Hatepunaea meridiana]|nr:T9SS type A sorting domain-containing protein [Candidatus Hatepunaea meridiana]
MKKYDYFIVLFCLMTSVALAQYDPPERLWFKEVGENDGRFSHWGEHYTYLHDQNGDGCDELLIAQVDGEGLGVNYVELYLGGREMDTEPDMLFGPAENEIIGFHTSFLGNLTGNGPYDFAISARQYLDGDGRPMAIKLYIYQGGEELDTIPDFTLSRYYDDENSNAVYIPQFENPGDINGDGYDDLILKERRDIDDEIFSQIVIYYGGAEFDTIPDIRLQGYGEMRRWVTRTVQTGYDLNNDGYDELLIYSQGYQTPHNWQFYLGGSPMDTVPLFNFGKYIFDNLSIVTVSMIDDVNNDNYDEFCFSVNDQINHRPSILWIFFGGDSLQIDNPNLWLEPYPVFPGTGNVILGGDINTDGYNDIIVNNPEAHGRLGQTSIYLCSPWPDSTADIVMSGSDIGDLRRMEMIYGAHSDFNGDGVNDFIIRSKRDHTPSHMAIYLGNRRWVVSVDEEPELPDIYKLDISANPNPFNKETTLVYSIPYIGNVKIDIFDVQGHIVGEYDLGLKSVGEHSILWNSKNNANGIYIVRVCLEGNNNNRLCL